MKTRIFFSLFAVVLALPGQTTITGFAGNAQHTADYPQTAQNINAVHWSTSVDLSNNGTLIHYGAPVVSAANTIFIPVKTAGDRFQVSAFNAASGAPVYTLPTDYLLPTHNWIPSYNPALATGPSGARLYYAGAGGTVYYVDHPDYAPAATPVQLAFYGLANYQANLAGFNASVFIDTPITSDNNGDIFFGYRVQGTAPAPLSTTQSGFARIDASGNATYVAAGVAAGDGNIARDSHNSAPALSNDGSTLYVLVKAADSDSYGYLLGLDNTTLATKYKAILKDPRNGNYATISEDSTASPMVAPDNDVFIGVLGNPEDNHRGYLLHFTGDLSVEKVPGAFGWDSTPAVVPASMVASYTGSSSYLIFSKYNDYAGDDGGEGINRIALLDPNSTQIDPHPSASGLTEMREVLTATGVTPDAYYVAAGYPMAVSEWCVNTPAVNSATRSIFIPSEDGHLYRWDLSTNSLAQTVSLAPGIGQAYVPVVLGPDGTAYTINGGNLFAVGNVSGNGIGVTSSVPDLRSAVAGQPLTFIAQVTGAGTQGVTPAGTVAFQNVSFQGATPLSIPLDTVPLDATGKASITVSGLAAGTHFITATFGSNSSTMVQLIHAASTSIKLTSSANPSRNDRNVTFTAAVIPSTGGSGVPTGMVTFTDGGNVLAQRPLVAGVASFAAPALAAGLHSIGAVYSSDDVFAASTATLAQRADGDPHPVGRDVSVTGTASSALRPRALSAGLLSGVGDSSENPANLTLEGTADWIHWGDSSVNRKATGGSQLSNYNVIGTSGVFGFQNDPRPLSWTDGTPTVSSTNNTNGVYFPYAGNGFSFTAPADTTVRTLVVHAGGYFSVLRLTAHLSDSSAPDYVDVTNPNTTLYDRNYTLTYSAASAGQTLTVTWVEVTDLGAGNVDLNAAALSIFNGTVATTSGNPQTTVVGTAFATALQVTVTDANNNPVSGATVTFNAPGSGAAASFSGAASATTVTNSNGVASAPTLTANGVAGSYYVTASVSGIPATAGFSLTNAAGQPVSIVATAGTPANAVVHTAFSTTLQATLKDANNNPVSGTTVTFTAPGSGPGASFAGGTTGTAVTNASGIAFAPVLTANGQTGSYVVTASVGNGVTPASYNLTNTAGGNGSLAGSANNSSAAVNLTAIGTSDWIHWGEASPNHKAAGGSQISNFSYANTMEAGSAVYRGVAKSLLTRLHPENMGFEGYGNDARLMSWSDGTPTAASNNNGDGFYIDYGTYIVSGRNGFTFTAPADGNLRTLMVYVGGTNTGAKLTAHLSDASAPDFVDVTALASGSYDRNYALTYSAGAPGQTITVTWSMTSGNGNVTLSAAALSVGVPANITATAGTPQSTLVNTAFGTALQATARDVNNNPLSGATVTFTAPSGGAGASFGGSVTATVTTNSSGIATAPALTANSQVGSYTVNATLAGVTNPAVFSLSNTIGGGSLSGSGNSASATTDLTTEGTADWVHWGDGALNRKAGVSAQIGNYTEVGSGQVETYNNDPRTLSWTDGTPTASASNSNGIYIFSLNNGFSFTVPADGNKRNLTVHVGGWLSGGTLTAHLSDQSAGDYVDTTAPASGQYDRNYTLTYSAASAGQTLTVSWVMTSGAGNVTLNGAALSGTGPGIAATGGTPQSATVNTAFAVALQATVTDAGNNPLSGITVTFSAPSSGAGASFSGSSTATAVTNSGGVALAPTLTANAQPGSYTVTAAVNGANTPASFSLTNTLGGASLTGAGNSATGSFNLTTEGPNDWVHWGGSAIIRKATGGSQISSYTVVGSGPVMNYTNDLRELTWTDGAPAASGSDFNGLYINSLQNGFSFTAPADTNKRTLTVHVGGWLSGGTLTAHLSDQSSPDYVDVTLPVNGQYDRNYTLTYTAASAGQTLTVSWVATSGAGNVTLNGVALAASTPGILPTAGTPQTVPVSTNFPIALQATVSDSGNNPLSGVSVTFTAPATGASATFNGSLTATVITNSGGVATAPELTANSQAGTYSVLASAPGVSIPASFNLTNTSVTSVGGSITGSGNSSAAAVNLSSEGFVDWVHWGNTPLTRKTAVSPQIGSYAIVGSGPPLNYNNDPRLLSWTDGTPVTASADNNGIYVNGLQNGFSFTVPADANPRTLIVHVGGWLSGGTLTAHLSDQSAADYVDITVPATGQYDRNYTVTYTAASAGQTLMVSWVATSGAGNVTLNAAALSMAGPSITAVAGTPQSATVNTVFGTALQAVVRDPNNNPLSGAMVTFTAPGTGASASFNGSLSATVATNSSGIATAPALTANGQAGSYTVIATAAGASTTVSYFLTNTLGGASLSGYGNSNAATVNLTQEGTADWVHWGVAGLNRKAAVSAQISNYGAIGSGSIMTYTNDPRTLSWSDGTPTAGGSDNEGIYINSSQNGFSFTVPADTTVRTLTVHAGGWFSAGTFTAHLSDISAPDYVDITAQASGQYDRNYTLTYSAASAGQTLTITWVNTSSGGNVTLNAAALR